MFLLLLLSLFVIKVLLPGGHRAREEGEGWRRKPRKSLAGEKHIIQLNNWQTQKIEKHIIIQLIISWLSSSLPPPHSHQHCFIFDAIIIARCHHKRHHCHHKRHHCHHCIVWRQETPKFGGEESQADVQDKLQHMRSMMTYLEASRLTRWLSTIFIINSYSSSSPNDLCSGTRRWTSWWTWRAGLELFIRFPRISTTAKTNKGSHRSCFNLVHRVSYHFQIVLALVSLYIDYSEDKQGFTQVLVFNFRDKHV